jgi:hypothetical protein
MILAKARIINYNRNKVFVSLILKGSNLICQKCNIKLVTTKPILLLKDFLQNSKSINTKLQKQYKQILFMKDIQNPTLIACVNLRMERRAEGTD